MHKLIFQLSHLLLKKQFAMNYLSARKLWRKTKHLYRSEEARDIWLPSLSRMRGLNPHGGWDKMDIDELQRTVVEYTYDITDVDDLLPRHFDTTSWRYIQRGETCPKFWDFVCHGACHYMVELHLWVITQVKPEHDWRIIQSDLHATIWNGKDLIYDPRFEAMKISINECFNMAYHCNTSKIILCITRCSGLTKKNKQCRNRVKKKGDFCYRHNKDQ